MVDEWFTCAWLPSLALINETGKHAPAPPPLHFMHSGGLLIVVILTSNATSVNYVLTAN